MAGPGGTPHRRSTLVGSNPRSRLFLGSAAEAGGYQIAGPRAEGLALALLSYHLKTTEGIEVSDATVRRV
jgi:hypothetical protein